MDCIVRKQRLLICLIPDVMSLNQDLNTRGDIVSSAFLLNPIDICFVSDRNVTRKM